MSIALLHRGLQARLEPGTPAPEARLDLVRRITDAGLPCGVMVAPVLPLLTDSAEALDALLGRIAAAGATGASVLALHLRPGTREWFLAWLAREHPALVESYARLYRRGAYVDPEYRRALGARVAPLLRRHGLTGAVTTLRGQVAAEEPAPGPATRAVRGAAEPALSRPSGAVPAGNLLAGLPGGPDSLGPVMRTHPAGTLRAEHAGQTVTLAGWVARRRDHGGVIFIDLRDASGSAQVVFREGEMAERAHRLRAEFCVQVTGEVVRRPAGNENPDLATGAIEVTATELTVLSESAPLPFPLDEHTEIGEEVRLKHRYLDLRRAGPAAALRLRSEANRIARTVMHERDFVEVETPTLTRSTPEGARDFLVPARLRPGSWYALPQSPQLFKQLLMVAGAERYYQIARCYRDEDFRADRQPEFTQLDIEMSFVTQDDVIELGEAVTAALWRELAGYEIPLPIPRLTYADAMARYGSDKPDLRFAIELTELTEYFTDTTFRVFQAPYVGSVVMPGGADQSRRQFDAWQEWAKQRGSRGLAYVTVGADGELGGPVAKNLSDGERDGLAKAAGAEPGDCDLLRRGPSRGRPRAARCRARRDRPPVRAGRRERVVVRLGRRRADVRADQGRQGQRAGLDGRAPPLHLAQRRVGRPVRGGAGRGAGLRLRHRLQRQRDRRRVDPYPPLGRAGSACSPCSGWTRRSSGRSSASCSTPSPTARRRTAASPSAGTAPACCWRGRTPCAR